MLYLHSNAVEKNTENSNFEDLEITKIKQNIQMAPIIELMTNNQDK